MIWTLQTWVDNGETVNAAPAHTDAENTQCVDKFDHCCRADVVFEYEGKHAGRAGKIALPDGVTGAWRQGRMKHRFDGAVTFKPVGNLQRRFFQDVQTYGKGLQSA